MHYHSIRKFSVQFPFQSSYFYIIRLNRKYIAILSDIGYVTVIDRLIIAKRLRGEQTPSRIWPWKSLFCDNDRM